MNTGKEFVKEAYRAIFQKDYQRAIEFFKKAIKRDSNNPFYYYKLSVTYARDNSLDDAMSAIQQALDLRPNDPLFVQHWQMLQGRMLSKKALKWIEDGEPAVDALLLLQQSIELDPISIPPRLLYACLLHQLGRKEEADKALQELLSLDPWHREARDLWEQWNPK